MYMRWLMEKQTKTKSIAIAAGMAFGAAATVSTIAEYFFKFTMVRKKKIARRTASAKENSLQRAQFAEAQETGEQWVEKQHKHYVYKKSHDGLMLAAELITAPDAKGTVICAHGYRSVPKHDFAAVAKWYHENGYNLLLVHLRACGMSQGKYITFGVKESRDIADWADWTAERFGRDMDIFLHGVSLGASSVMMACGYKLPKNVRGVIADCGFISPYRIFSHIMTKDYHLPVFPLLGFMESISKRRAGIGFNDEDTVRTLAKSEVPVLFIHGDQDDFVPFAMTLENYKACGAEKELVIVEGAMHGMSCLVAPERCLGAIEGFLNKYSSKTEQ